MRRLIFILIFGFLLVQLPYADARRGCCSHHGGVCGCSCCDGTPLSAKCAPYYPDCTNNQQKPSIPSTDTPPITTKSESFYHCIRVVDGDTIVLEGNKKVARERHLARLHLLH